MRSWKLLAVISAIVVAGGLYLWARVRAPSEQEKIRRLLATAERGVEKRDIGKFMSVFSKSYSDSVGFGYLSLRMFCAERFKEYDKISVRVEDIRIELSGETASVAMNLTIEARSSGALEGGVWTRDDMRLRLTKEGGKWRIIGAEFQLD